MGAVGVVSGVTALLAPQQHQRQLKACLNNSNNAANSSGQGNNVVSSAGSCIVVMWVVEGSIAQARLCMAVLLKQQSHMHC
jgi:predicted phage tail protein